MSIMRKNEYIDFSEYSNDYIYEINTKEDFLLFIEQKKDIRKNKNITLDSHYHKNNVINSTRIFIERDEYSYSGDTGDIIYIFAGYDENYFENFQNECYIYEILTNNINDGGVTIIKNNIDVLDFENALRKDIKFYIFTKIVQLRKEKKNIYFYYPLKIEVTQWVLDSVFNNSQKSNSTNWKLIIILMTITIIFLAISACLKNKNKNNNVDFNLNNNNNDNNENLHPILND